MGDRPTIVLPFGEGLDRATGASLVQPARAADLRNVELYQGAALARRGITQRLALLDGTSGPVDSVVCVTSRRSDQTNLTIVRDGTELRYSTGFAATSLWLNTGGVAATDMFHTAEVNGLTFLAHDPVVGPSSVHTRYYDGATVTTLDTNLDGLGLQPTKFRGVVEHLGYLFGWGYGSNSDPNRPEVVRASLPGQPTVFRAEHYFLAGAKGSRVYACVPLGGELLVFKETGIHAIIGTNRANFGIVPRDRVYGLAGPKLWAVVDDVCYFWSVQGPRATTGGPSVEIGRPLGLDDPEPALVTRGGNYQGFAVHVPGKEMIRFIFGKRCYNLHLRDRGNPRWTYDEYQVELRCGGLQYDTDLSAHAYLAPAVGERFGQRLGWLDRGNLDFDQRYQVLGLSNPVAPAGRAGECVFPAVYLTLTHTMACTIRVTPYVDGVAGTAVDVALAAKGSRTTEVREVPFPNPLVQSAVERGRFFLRGTWFQLKIETLVDSGGLTPGIGTGDLLLEEAALEHEVVTETRAAG